MILGVKMVMVKMGKMVKMVMVKMVKIVKMVMVKMVKMVILGVNTKQQRTLDAIVTRHLRQRWHLERWKGVPRL